MDVEFTHELISVDIENGTMEVRYIPEDSNLSIVLYNIRFVLSQEENATFEDHYENSIRIHAPFGLWQTQKAMIENADELQQKIV
jgi:hypothetical protein